MLVVEQIKRAVCVEFGLFKSELEACEPGKIEIGRMVAMALVRRLTDLTLTQIGHRFGGRHRSVVSRACKRADPYVAAAERALPSRATPRQWVVAIETVLELPE